MHFNIVNWSRKGGAVHQIIATCLFNKNLQKYLNTFNIFRNDKKTWVNIWTNKILF